MRVFFIVNVTSEMDGRGGARCEALVVIGTDLRSGEGRDGAELGGRREMRVVSLELVKLNRG